MSDIECDAVERAFESFLLAADHSCRNHVLLLLVASHSPVHRLDNDIPRPVLGKAHPCPAFSSLPEANLAQKCDISSLLIGTILFPPITRHFLKLSACLPCPFEDIPTRRPLTATHLRKVYTIPDHHCMSSMPERKRLYWRTRRSQLPPPTGVLCYPLAPKFPKT